ncbi:MAG: putative lipid II flippase FtsW [Chromatiales bacterium]|nr:putative lipid II flippase FtsW [Chromatiales bacterium]
MSIQQAIPVPREQERQIKPRAAGPDLTLLLAALALLALGLVMVASASLQWAEDRTGQAFYFANRQALFLLVGLIAGWLAWRTPTAVWEKQGPLLFLFGLVLLMLVLVPELGREVNGSKRWLPLGPFNLQPSELMKLFAVFYVADYLVRRGQEVRSGWQGFLKPLVLLVVAAMLLLAEPDFGATAVLLATVLGMMYIGGARLWQFGVLIGIAALLAVTLVLTTDYRLDRVLYFTDPWADPYNKGFQLIQALIAFGRGDWLGVGLGAGVQKLAYLPEAHTDFLFAVIGEELGAVGCLSVISLFSFLTWRALSLSERAHRLGRYYASFLACGLGLLIGMQAFLNLGVNLGLLPTKGLTLPLMSYGGSSLVVACIAVGVLLRVHDELAEVPLAAAGED